MKSMFDHHGNDNGPTAWIDDSNPSLGFAEGMPSMEVVKLWQSLPNEGHPMLLSLKTMEWINFFMFICELILVYLYIKTWHRYILYIDSPLGIHRNPPQNLMGIPGRIGKIRHCKS